MRPLKVAERNFFSGLRELSPVGTLEASAAASEQPLELPRAKIRDRSNAALDSIFARFPQLNSTRKSRAADVSVSRKPRKLWVKLVPIKGQFSHCTSFWHGPVDELH